jgi:hypothetical protein
METLAFSTGKIVNTGAERTMTECEHPRNGVGEHPKGMIARVGGSVSRVAAGVRRALSPLSQHARNTLIARTWWGTTRATDADRYLAYLQETGLREYQDTAGNRGVLALRRVADGRADFLLISFWSSDQAIRDFAGDEPNRARFYPEDDRYLLDGDGHAVHYEVVFGNLPFATEATHA